LPSATTPSNTGTRNACSTLSAPSPIRKASTLSTFRVSTSPPS
jgi:hypothetical protein